MSAATKNLPDRQMLYQQVWAQTLPQVALLHGVKTWDIQKWCKELHVPLPDRAYWSRHRHGHPVKPPPLPVLQAAAPKAVPFPKENGLSFKVPDRLKDLDTITLAVQKDLQLERADPHYVYTEPDHFPVRVTKASAGRALRILDTLIKCWRRRGYRIELRGREAFIWLRAVRQRVSLWEISKSAKGTKPGERRNLVPTGKLAIRMDWWNGRDWRDGARPLEEQIKDILDHMELSARQLEREREHKVEPITTVTIDEEVQPEPEIIAEDPVNLPEPKAAVPDPVALSHRSELDLLIAEAQRWKELKTLDEYLNALQLAVPHTPAFLDWLNEARALRKSNDPLIARLLK